MSKDDEPKVPVLRVAKEIVRAGKSELSFEPGDFQSRVKARFYRRIDEMSHRVDRETVFGSKELMVSMAGTDRILAWLEIPAFATWFTDAELISDLIASHQERNIRAIVAVRDGEHTSDGDKIKAARTMLELADAFPGKKSEVRFLDDRINDMTESETEKEIRKLQAKMESEDD